MIWLLLVGCFKTYVLNGQVRDTNGKPIKNAIVTVDVAEVETRSDKRGKFSLSLQYNKKKAPYILQVTPLAHKEYTETLEFGKETELTTKLTLKAKEIYLPYSKNSIDMENQEVLNLSQNQTATEETPDNENDAEAAPPSEEEEEQEASDENTEQVPPSTETQEEE